MGTLIPMSMWRIFNPARIKASSKENEQPFFTTLRLSEH